MAGGPGAGEPAGRGETPIEEFSAAEIARVWVEFRLLTRHGPCRNCERMHGGLARLRATLVSCPGDGESEGLLAAVREVRRPATLHAPLGCQPCSTEAALEAGRASRNPGA